LIGRERHQRGGNPGSDRQSPKAVTLFKIGADLLLCHPCPLAIRIAQLFRVVQPLSGLVRMR
jgi:hypothetical protein